MVCWSSGQICSIPRFEGSKLDCTRVVLGLKPLLLKSKSSFVLKSGSCKGSKKILVKEVVSNFYCPKIKIKKFTITRVDLEP